MSALTTDTNIVQEGWAILVAQMGLQKATEFVILLERGKGDSVKEIADYWGNAAIDDIEERITEWKSKKQ